MKLNTKLGIGKKPAPTVEVVEKIIEVHVIQKPSSFSLDVQRNAQGVIESVRAWDKDTGKIYYEFAVLRDREGSVKTIAATPH